jgi:hypothetical protein
MDTRVEPEYDNLENKVDGCPHSLIKHIVNNLVAAPVTHDVILRVAAESLR